MSVFTFLPFFTFYFFALEVNSEWQQNVMQKSGYIMLGIIFEHCCWHVGNTECVQFNSVQSFILYTNGVRNIVLNALKLDWDCGRLENMYSRGTELASTDFYMWPWFGINSEMPIWRMDGNRNNQCCKWIRYSIMTTSSKLPVLAIQQHDGSDSRVVKSIGHKQNRWLQVWFLSTAKVFALQYRHACFFKLLTFLMNKQIHT